MTSVENKARYATLGLGVLFLLLEGAAAAGRQQAPAPDPSAGPLVVPRSASIGRPRGIAVDAAGNVYFTSSLNDVFKLAPNGEITIVAGASAPGFSGDGGLAVSAQLDLTTASVSAASGVVVDAGGNVYIADTANHRIRKVSPAGVISTIAGTGRREFSGDGGPAINAPLADPSGLALDAAGNLYVADFNNVRVRRIGVDGVITTVAGSGKRGYDGDGGPATAASMGEPTGIAFDAVGNLYIADSNNFCVRRVSPGGVITTAAVRGVASPATASSPLRTQLGWTYGVATAGSAVIITDSEGVRRLSTDGSIVTLAKARGGYSGDGGPAATATLSQPVAAAVDRAGNIFLADSGNFRIRRIGPDGVITTAAGTGFSPDYGGDGGPALQARLNLRGGGEAQASALAIDTQGNLYVTDVGNDRVRKISTTGIISTVAGDGTRGDLGDGGPATRAQLREPSSIAVDRAGNLFIGERNSNRVRKVAATGTITTLPDLAGPSALAADLAGNLYVVASDGQVRKVAPDGAVSLVGVPSPGGLAVDAAGTVYAAGDRRLLKIAPSGLVSRVAAGAQSGVSIFGRFAVDRAGRVYVAEVNAYRVMRFDENGSASIILGRGFRGASADDVWANAEVEPMGIAVDARGNVYVADAGGRWRDSTVPPRVAGWREVCPAADCILKIAPDGTVSRFAGGGASNLPRAPSPKAVPAR